MKTLIYDTEGNGLREEVTRMWCIVCKENETGKVLKFKPDEIELGIRVLESADRIVCHNQIGYDLQVFKKLYGWEPPPDIEIVDTLVLSRLYNPERRVPKGWKGINAPHSIEAWGMRFSRYKPVHEDWSKYTPEMLFRCEEDVEIQSLVYNHFVERYGDPYG